jgi:RING-variant domain
MPLEKEKRFCWICYSGEPEKPSFEVSDAELIAYEEAWVSPCECKGSTEWVHQACILSWIQVQAQNSIHSSHQTMSIPVTKTEIMNQIRSHSISADINNQRLDESLLEQGSSRPTRTASPTLLSSCRARMINFWGYWTHSSKSKSSVIFNTALCCPQCKTAYAVYQDYRPSALLPLAYSYLRSHSEIIGLGSVSLLLASTYCLFWVFGHGSLEALLGHDSTLYLYTGLAAPHTLLEVTEENWKTSIVPILRSHFYTLIGIPMYSLVVTVMAKPQFENPLRPMYPAMLFLFGQLYIPSHVILPHNNGTLYCGYLKWLVPVACFIYQRYRQHYCFARHIAIDMIRPFDDIGANDSLSNEIGADGGTGNESGINASPASESDNASVLFELEAAAGLPSNGVGLGQFSRSINLSTFPWSTLLSLLLLPFTARFTSIVLLRIFRPTNLPTQPLIHLLLRPIFSRMMPLPIQSLYHSLATFLHRLPIFYLNLFSASTLTLLQDAAQIFISKQRQHASVSKKVLDFKLYGHRFSRNLENHPFFSNLWARFFTAATPSANPLA